MARRRSVSGLAQPRASRAKTEVIRLRVEPALKAQVEIAAAGQQQTTSAYATEALELALARGSTR